MRRLSGSIRLTTRRYACKEAKGHQSTDTVRHRTRDAEDEEDDIADVVDRLAAVKLGERCPEKRPESIAQNVDRCDERAEGLVGRIEVLHDQGRRRCAHRGCEGSGELLATKCIQSTLAKFRVEIGDLRKHADECHNDNYAAFLHRRPVQRVLWIVHFPINDVGVF